MKGRSILGLMVSLTVLGAGSLAVLAQSQHSGVSNNSTDDISSILNLVRSYGAIGEIVIIDNYASLNYFFGQNGDTVTLARQNGRWRIVAGRQTTSCARGSCQTDSCRADVNCLVRKGVPRNIAIQLISRLENAHARQERNVQSFRQAWARSNRNIAPFLGYWQNQNWPQTSQEIAISIWPSYRENKVCIIGISENSQYVIEGTVDGNTIRTQNGNFTLNRPVDFTEYIDSTKHFLIGAQPLNTWYLNSANNQKLENAGCTASLPQTSQTASNRSPQISQNINQFNRFTIGTLSTGERVLRVPRQYMSQSPFKEALQRPLRPLRDNPDFYSQDWPGIFLWNGRTIHFTGIGVDSIAEFKAGNQTYWLTTINSLVSNSLEVSKPNFIDSREVRGFQDAYAAIKRKDTAQEGFFYVEARYGNGSGYPVITYLSDFRIAVTNPNQSVIVCEVSRYTYTGNGNSPTIENPNCRTAQQVLAQRSPSSGQQTGTERSQSSTPSLMRPANFQSVRGVKVELAKEPIRDFRQLQGNYSFILDRDNSRKLPDGTEVFSFDVYNTGYADGVIEVRNARAELVEIRAIEGVRNPTNPISFGSFSIQKQWDSFTDFMNGRWFNDPRFATAQQKKTTIENIALPPGGSITFTKTGANARAYNQATLVMGFFFGGWLSESEENPASLPGALNRIFGEDATFKQKFLAALFLKFQEKRIGSLVKEGAFQDLPSTLQAFTTASWIEEQNFNELVKTGIEVFLQEGIKYGITDRVLKEKLFGASLKSWVTAAEIFAKGGNVFLQNLDLERSKIAEEKKGPLAIIYPR